MDRLDKIYRHFVYRREADALRCEEQCRKFCKHGVEHLIDVARLCTIYCLQDGIVSDEGVSIEVIYAAALLHDIGRHEQNVSGVPHEEAGARIAREILQDCGFDAYEIDIIADAILHHRTNSNDRVEDKLAYNLRKADKKSRLCYDCDAINECNWSDEKKNTKVGM